MRLQVLLAAAEAKPPPPVVSVELNGRSVPFERSSVYGFAAIAVDARWAGTRFGRAQQIGDSAGVNVNGGGDANGFGPLAHGTPDDGCLDGRTADRCECECLDGRAADRPPEGTDVVTLNNNQYAPSLKAATADAFLSSRCALSRLVGEALRRTSK